MSKLYPPGINGTIPAFYGTTLVVPFSMNLAVSNKEVVGFAVKIKTASGELVGVVRTDTNKNSTFNIEEQQVIFDTSESGLMFSIGQYYKIQLAYIDEYGDTGYYSTVGVIKYTTEPSVYIQGLTFGKINPNLYQYIGVYSQENGDTTEKMYSSNFQLLNADDEVIVETGEILHNTANDDLVYEQHEIFKLLQDLDLDESYYLQFTVTTLNKLVASSSKYRLVQRHSIPMEGDLNFVASLNYDNGFIELNVTEKNGKTLFGTFTVSRAASNNDYKWEEFATLNFQSIVAKQWIIKDLSIEHGVTYKYSLQQFNNNGIYSERVVSNSVTAAFEDMFLYDGERQLKIRFNPSVDVFKNILQEQKIETIGSRYPHFTRNGKVNYKELALGGLISYKMDNDQYFYSKKDYNWKEDTINLVDTNLYAERCFRDKVNEWLINGKPKVFKSPTEGNFIVRLLNVALSAEKRVGRMLYNFTCSAYEIAECNMENLLSYGLVNIIKTPSFFTRWAQFNLRNALYTEHEGLTAITYEPNKYYITDEDRRQYILSTGVTYNPLIKYYDFDNNYQSSNEIVDVLTNFSLKEITFRDMQPGSIVYLKTSNAENVYQPFIIGSTGTFNYKVFSENQKIIGVAVQKNALGKGNIIYSYVATIYNTGLFGNIIRATTHDVPVKQIIGNSIDNVYYENLLTDNVNVKTSVFNYNFIRFKKRPVFPLYVDLENPDDYFPNSKSDYSYYFDPDKKRPVNNDFTELNPLYLYRLYCVRQDYRGFNNESYFIDANHDDFCKPIAYCIDGLNHWVSEWKAEVFQILIDNKANIDINETEFYIMKQVNHIESIKVGPGIITEFSYTEQIRTFQLEETDAYVRSAKNIYEDELERYLETRDKLTFEDDLTSLENMRHNVKLLRDIYYKELEKAIIAFKKAEGINFEENGGRD